MSIDTHAKVSSADQDAWVELAELLRNNLLRLVMQPNLTLEDLRAIRNAAWEIKAFHVVCLAFDAQLEATREKLLHGECGA